MRRVFLRFIWFSSPVAYRSLMLSRTLSSCGILNDPPLRETRRAKERERERERARATERAREER